MKDLKKNFCDALVQSLEMRKKFYENFTEAWRLVHRHEWRDLDVVIDVYRPYLSLWFFEEHYSLQDIYGMLEPALHEFQRYFDFKGIVIKKINKNPHVKKLVQDSLCVGNVPENFWIQENGLFYKINLKTSQHSGLFLDQRDNRKLIKSMAQNKRVANLFSYTCSFSVAAAAGNAEVVCSVDTSHASLRVGMENFEKNQLHLTGRGKFVAEDARKWLEKQKRKIAAGVAPFWDIVVCDPPTFSKTKQGEFRVEDEWEFLVSSVAAILHPQTGFAFFSNNHQSKSSEYYAQILRKYFPKIHIPELPLDFRFGDSNTVKQFHAYKAS